MRVSLGYHYGADAETLTAQLAGFRKLRAKRGRALTRAQKRGRSAQVSRSLRAVSDLDRIIGRLQGRIGALSELSRIPSPVFVLEPFPATATPVECGARTASGRGCSRIVKAPGERCYAHKQA
jgi:hypothetical protein